VAQRSSQEAARERLARAARAQMRVVETLLGLHPHARSAGAPACQRPAAAPSPACAAQRACAVPRQAARHAGSRLQRGPARAPGRQPPNPLPLLCDRSVRNVCVLSCPPRTWNWSSFCILGALTRGYFGSRARISVLGLRARRRPGERWRQKP
jgi:hypothetical protein